jgi:UDP-N-acetylglucosamine 4,6-dehydratase
VLDAKVVLITGGTGSFGRSFTEYVLGKYKLKKLIIFSRDEFKQYEMSRIFPADKYPIRYFLGDIRDKDRLNRAFDSVDVVVHAAALKHVPSAEYNPFEAVKTNIIGAQNIVEAAIDKGVKKVLALSTDKAVSPINLYGATKLAMEKIFIAASAYVGPKDTRFAIVRYGNVVGSRGSVIPAFLRMVREGARELPVTDERMTRFWITMSDAVDFVDSALFECVGGEVFVPKIPSMKVLDLVSAISPGPDDCKVKIIGIRSGEKLHETLITWDEAGTAVEYELGAHGDPQRQMGCFVVLPDFHFESKSRGKYKKSKRLSEGFSYRSDTNDTWITVERMKQYIEDLKASALNSPE